MTRPLPPPDVLLPLYVHPVDDPGAWAAAARLGPDRGLPPDAGVTVVVNVHNGPGDGSDPTYGPATAALHRAGVPMLGYVDFGYGSRPDVDLDRDIARWRPYRVGGVFFDRVPSGPAHLPAVARAVRAAAGRVVLNPGTRPHDGYGRLGCTVCTFEGPWSSYVIHDDRPDWPMAAHLVYGVPRRHLPEAEHLLRRRVRCGLVTDLTTPLPYRGLPAWLAAGRTTRPVATGGAR